MYVYTYVCMHVCMQCNVCMYMYVCMHVHTVLPIVNFMTSGGRPMTVRVLIDDRTGVDR